MSVYLLVFTPLGGLLSSFILCLFFWRSSPMWPKTLHQLWIELLFQYYGFRAFIEDKWFQKANFVELSMEEHRIAIVTGGNRGIGVHVVNKLLNCGMTVIVAVRSPDRAWEEISRIVDVFKFEEKLLIESLDISATSSIRQFTERITAKFEKIDILIHNAGIMACPFKKSEDGFESQMATNYLGPFLLTHLLMPQLRAAGTEHVSSRIVLVTSVLHFAGKVPFPDFHSSCNYYPVEAYMNSKLCQVVMAKEWQRMFDRANWKVQAYSVHPGIVNTEIIQYLAKKRMWWRRNMCKTPEQGSCPIVYAAISKDLKLFGGDYISNCERTGPKSVSADVGLKLYKFSCNMLKIDSFGFK